MKTGPVIATTVEFPAELKTTTNSNISKVISFMPVKKAFSLKIVNHEMKSLDYVWFATIILL